MVGHIRRSSLVARHLRPAKAAFVLIDSSTPLRFALNDKRCGILVARGRIKKPPKAGLGAKYFGSPTENFVDKGRPVAVGCAEFIMSKKKKTCKN